MNNIFLVGIFFDALVSATVATAAILFVFFLFRRWTSLDTTRRAYAWFWFFTMLTWVTITIRYFAVSFGYLGVGVYIGDIIVEGAIFFTGPPLFYYLGLSVFKNNRVASCLATVSAVLAFMSMYFLIMPGGISAIHMTDFSADVSINTTSLYVFSSQIVLIILFILYGIFSYIFKRHGSNTKEAFYQLLYSMPLLVYVALGAIDQSKIILDWPLVVFRVLYASAFLFAYLVIVEESKQNEQYLVEYKRV